MYFKRILTVIVILGITPFVTFLWIKYFQIIAIWFGLLP